MGLFSGLESLGLGQLKNMDVFEEDKKEDEKKQAELKKKAEVKVDENSLLLDKTYTCPVCDHEFKTRAVKTGRARMIAQDIDLRPRYADIDALKYGVVVCPVCGYAALLKNFSLVGSAQAKLIKQQISQSFMGLGPDKAIFSYDDAITRHKLALVNSVVKRGKMSERAYTCMVIAWLLRAKRETLPLDTPDRDAVIAELKAEEMDSLSKARDGFKDAFSKETFPLYSLDETTSIYVIAALAAETGEKDEALRWVSRLITSTSANDRIKEKGRILKEKINNGEF